jgi:zinc/manganese transport system substrate-binding protein
VITVTRGLEDRLIHHLTPLAIDDAKGSRKAPAKDDHDHEHDHDHAGEDGNPHVWLDPVFAKHCVSNIITALCQADPAHADGYTRRGDSYLRELDQLDGEIRSSLKALTQRKVVTFHDAFPYFCQRYDLKLVGVVEEVPSVDPSPKYLARLSRAIRDQGVRVIFSEPQFHPRLLKRLASDLQVGVAELDVLETGTASKTFYVDGMRGNLRTLEAALR